MAKKEKEWFTQSEFARAHGISREAVRQAVLNGRLESNGKRGRDCRVRGELAESARITVPNASSSTAGDLAEAKLQKLLADIELQRQKISENIDLQRRSYIGMIIEEYTKAFAPLKVKLSELRLDPVQLEVLRNTIEACTRQFTSEVEKRLNETS
jgi:hypothetical protein